MAVTAEYGYRSQDRLRDGELKTLVTRPPSPDRGQKEDQVQSGNTWGLCRTCDRWFHCPEWFDTFAPQPLCPTCGAEPDAVVVRDEPIAPAQTRIEGQCPQCRSWFDADTWFDDSAPVPCCPDCDMVPDKLAYVHGSGKRVERVLTVDLVGSEQWLG